MENKSLVRLFTQQPAVRDLECMPAQAILALRYAILCRRSGQDPLPELERRWGNILAARRFRVLVEAIGHIWPDPFALAPPCCPRMSFDEGLLASILTVARRDDRMRFDFLTAEMLDSDARDLLYACAQNLIRAQPPSR